MISFKKIWKGLMGDLIKHSDIISQIDPMSRIQMGHPLYQRMFNSFFETLKAPEATEVKSKTIIRRKTGDPATGITVKFVPEDFSVRIQYHDTDIIKFLPNEVELDNGGWYTKFTAIMMNRFLSHANVPLTIRHVTKSYHRPNASELGYMPTKEEWMQMHQDLEAANSVLYVRSSDNQYYRMDDHIVVASYEGLVTNLSPWEGLHIAGEGALKFPSLTKTADIIQNIEPEDYDAYLASIADKYPEYEHPPESEAIDEVEAPPPSTVAQEHYPRMTPQQMLDAHAEHVQGFQKYLARKKAEVERDNKIADEYETICSEYAQRHGWELMENRQDWDTPKSIYAKKFADGVHLVQIEGWLDTRTPLYKHDVEEILYDSNGWTREWNDIFSNKAMLEELMKNRGYTEFEDVDPMEYISWDLMDNGYRPDYYNETGSDAYKAMLSMMYKQDTSVRPFNEREFYAPAHWPHPRQKPDPSQLSMVNYEGELLPQPKTEKELRPYLYTGLTFEFTKTGDILSAMAPLQVGDVVQIVSRCSLGGFYPHEEKAYPITAEFPLSTLTNYHFHPSRVQDIVGLSDTTRIYVVDSSYYLAKDLLLVRMKTADIIRQPSMQEKPELPPESSQPASLLSTLVYFDGGDKMLAWYDNSVRNQIHAVAIAEGQIGYLKGKYHQSNAPDVIVYFKEQPDAAEIQRRRTNGFLGARWFALPVEPLVNPIASLKFSDIINSFRELGNEEEEPRNEEEDTDAHREVFIAPLDSGTNPSQWGIFDVEDDSWIGTENSYEDAVQWIESHHGWVWSEKDVPPERYLRSQELPENAPIRTQEVPQLPTETLPQWTPLKDAYELMQVNDIWLVHRKDIEDEGKSWTIKSNERTAIGRKMFVKIGDVTYGVNPPKTHEELYEARQTYGEPTTATMASLKFARMFHGWISPEGEHIDARDHDEAAFEIIVNSPQYQREFASYPKSSSMAAYVFLLTKGWIRVVGTAITIGTLTSNTKNLLIEYVAQLPKSTHIFIEEWYVGGGIQQANYRTLFEGGSLEFQQAFASKDESMMKTANWLGYLSRKEFDADTFFSYARPNQVWSFQRVGQAQLQGQYINRFVKITSLSSELGQVHGVFGNSLEECMSSDKDISTGFPVEDGWTQVRFVQVVQQPKEVVE